MNLTPGSAIVIESVPNFSEGRRPEVVQAIVTAIQAPGVRLLNYSSDWDHNRSVVTIAGSPEAVLQGLVQATAVAAAQINLFEQRGAHPRLGATDVVPLIPLQNVSLADCVALARQLSARIGDEIGLPVYLYESAATRPERRLLADVRRGEFEALVDEIDLPHRRPDFGPSTVGSAGAVIVGARPFLIAYNIFLKTNNVLIAKQISRAIREKHGGLPGVRALGLLVDGQAQVSMNLVDFQQTSIPVVFDEVTRLAAIYQTAIDRSELIGLMPEEALRQVATHYLKLPTLAAEQILELAYVGNPFESAVPESQGTLTTGPRLC
ncbi:MAG: glutamate formimidoyltransferase [Caldilineaceae bacterium]